MTQKLLFTLAAAMMAASLAGCSRSPDEPAPVEEREGADPAEDVSVTAPPEGAPTVTETTPAPVAETPATMNDAAELPPEEAPAPDAQMMDDAAATGMTARVTRDEPAAGDGTPAEQVEQK